MMVIIDYCRLKISIIYSSAQESKGSPAPRSTIWDSISACLKKLLRSTKDKAFVQKTTNSSIEKDVSLPTLSQMTEYIQRKYDTQLTQFILEREQKKVFNTFENAQFSSHQAPADSAPARIEQQAH